MHISKIRNCGNCNYYVLEECRQDSPVADDNGFGVWPEVCQDHWCGQWTDRSEIINVKTIETVANLKFTLVGHGSDPIGMGRVEIHEYECPGCGSKLEIRCKSMIGGGEAICGCRVKMNYTSSMTEPYLGPYEPFIFKSTQKLNKESKEE